MIVKETSGRPQSEAERGWFQGVGCVERLDVSRFLTRRCFITPGGHEEAICLLLVWSH